MSGDRDLLEAVCCRG